MAIPFSNTHLRVPAGFRNLLEGLAREVLRTQPQDVVAFAAEHFQALLEERERSSADPAEWGAQLEDRFYNNPAFQEPGPDGAEASLKELPFGDEDWEKRQEAVTKIQAAFRGFRARRELKQLREAASRESWA